ncbi:hypothetical protein BJP36_16990 [Moorena producens JHB]|uniref:LamG-like jellyroll fold domain-containing protein n=1 Tax=Moorena producens (strain JHB) TaxID=1454205 RepID=A0A1D9G153_MOOP1|nr:LamG domain-containing protein [Moorena producens]AOY81348.1 hypothetical protein BJP36_16990 [Moorena producens JHB]
MSIYQEFRTTFTDKNYKYTTTVLHSGFVVAFAMDNERKIYYTVLDSMQAPVELPEPRLLFFPEEITKVGYGVFYPTPMPIVKDNTREELEEGRIDKQDQDPFLSTTACLTADQPFYIFSDGSYIYLFRQAIDQDHEDMVYPIETPGGRGTRDQEREDIVKGPDGNPVPVANQTLLVDRFVFALGGEQGPTLQPKLEIRYQRSKHKTLRQSNKDTLGTQDMAENKFYEPTQELSLVGKMHEGMFSVLQLPTQVNQQKRWQIFCYNNTTELLDSYNIEVAKDGLFNTFGTRHYTSPDPEYQSAVFERQPGICPFTKKPLILITDRGGAAESALQFTGDDSVVTVDNTDERMDIFKDKSFTVECWAKAETVDGHNRFFTQSGLVTAGIVNGQINFHFSDSDQVSSSDLEIEEDWHHYAFVYNKDNKKMEIYWDGVQVAEGTANNHAQSTGDFSIGTYGDQYFQGTIDEMRIWNYPRPQVQIEQEMNYRLVGNETGLMNYWRFDEGSGDTVYDKTNRACHGTLSGSNKPQWVASDAPVGDNPGVSRTSIKLSRGIRRSFSSLFYYEQETNDTDADGIKNDGRVMLAIGTSVEESKILILDIGVGNDGKLAQIPDAVNLEEELSISASKRLQDVDPKELKQRAYSISNYKQDVQETKKQILQIHQQLQELDKLLSKKELEAKQTALATIAQELLTLPLMEPQPSKILEDVDPKQLKQRAYSISNYKQDLQETKKQIVKIRQQLQKLDKLPSKKELEAKQKSLATIAQELKQNYRPEEPEYKKLVKRWQELTSPTKPLSFGTLTLVKDKIAAQLEQVLNKEQELPQKQQELADKLKQIAELNQAISRNQNAKLVPLHLLAIDPYGLTVKGGILDFARTNIRPEIRECGPDKLGLYFQERNSNQFSVAYFDITTAKAKFTSESDSENTLTWLAYNGEVEMNDAEISITDGSTPETCTLTIKALDYEETWTGAPRQVDWLQLLINYGVTEFEQEEEEENKKESTITAVKTLKYNSQDRAVVYSGSMLFNLSLGVAPGTSSIVNGAATKSGNGKTTGWTSPRASESLLFHEDDYISTENPVQLKGFDSDADAVTLETWVKPTVIPAKERPGNLPVLALRFEGNTYMDCGHRIDLKNKSFTIEFWVRRMESNRDDWCLTQGSAFRNHEYLHIGFRQNNQFSFAFYYNDLSCDAQYSDNNWHHWACVYDESAKSRMIYRDGELVISQDSDVQAFRGDGALWIAGHLGGSKAKVEMMEVRVWDTARTKEQIRQKMRQQVEGNESRLVAYWKLEDSVWIDQKWAEFSPNNYWGNYYNSNCANLVSKFRNSSYTIEFWMKSKTGDEGAFPLFIGDSGNFTAGIMVGKFGANHIVSGKRNKLGIRSNNKDPEIGGKYTSTQWTHYAYIYDTGSNKAIAYTNGAKHGETNFEAFSGGGDDFKIYWKYVSEANIEIGDVRLWNRALSESEVNKSRNNTRWIETNQNSLLAHWLIDGSDSIPNLANNSEMSSYNLTKYAGINSHSRQRRQYLDSCGTNHGTLPHRFDTDETVPIVITAPDISLEAPDAPSNYLIYHQNKQPSNLLNISQYGISMLPKYAFRFNGENYITCGDKIDLRNKSFTVEFWAKRLEDGRDDWLCSQGTSETNKGLHIGFRGNNNKFSFAFYSNDLDCDIQYSDKNWHHWACVYDYSARSRKIYRDGELVASQDSNVTPFQGAGVWNLGRRFDNASKAKADLVEVRIWSSALTQEEIRESIGIQIFPETAGLVAYWRLDSSNTDDSKNAHHGTIEGAVQLGEAPAFSLTATFDNHTYRSQQGLFQNSWTHLAFAYFQSFGIQLQDSDSLEVPDTSVLSITKDLTLELFCQPAQIKASTLLAKTGVSSNNTQLTSYKLETDQNGYLVFSFQNQDGTWKTYTSNQALVAKKLQKVAVVRKTELVDQTHSETIEIGDREQKVEVQIPEVNTRIIFYIYGKNTDENKEVGKSNLIKDVNPGIGNFPVKIGESFNGIITDVRIWNIALEPEFLGQLLYGQETGGLVAWWPLNEKEGNIAYDSIGENHGKITGLNWQWVKTPDPDANICSIYLNGQPVELESAPIESQSSLEMRAALNDSQFSLGAAKTKEGSFFNFLHGEMDEIRIWKTFRLQQQIQENLFTYVKGEKKDLIAYFSCNLTEDDNLLKDESFTGNDLTFPTNGNNKPARKVSNAPIGDDIALVRSAIDGYTQQYQTVIHGFPSVVDYGVMFNDPIRGTSGSLQRLYTYIYNNQWHLVHGFKVANLKTQWMAQVQFDPQIIGFIEGAPPVPSENLTVGPKNYQVTYDGTTAVELTEVNSYKYSYSHSRKHSVKNGFDYEAAYSGEIDLTFVLAPLGLGKAISPQITGTGISKNKIDSDNGFTDKKTMDVGETTTENTKQQLKGYWQQLPNQDSETSAYNPILGVRYLPDNVGFALVLSDTADVFALRFEHNNALFSYSVRPNPDIPKDFNLIPFKINPQYTKQGTLDGKIGYDQQGAVFLDPDYPTASDYGEYSYFKPKEAYNLKEQITRQEKDLTAYYENFNVSYSFDNYGWSDAAIAAGTAGIVGGVGMGIGYPGKKERKRRGLLRQFQKSGGGIHGNVSTGRSLTGFRAWMGGLSGSMGSLAATTASTTEALVREFATDQKLPDKFAKQDIVNTYVWSADGGFYSQSTQTAQTRTQSFEGSFTGSFQLGSASSFDVKFEIRSHSKKTNGFNNIGLSLTKSRSKEDKETFEIKTTFNLSNNIQQYDYSEDPSKGEPVYDSDGNPVLCPGKVDAYRFMTFFLQEDNENYNQLFNKVIDPIWLNESNDKNAIALRGAYDPANTPPCWRVMHRVTFVSRILPEIGAETPPLEKELKELDISSYYELIKRLEPFVVSSADSYDNLLRAVNDTLYNYYPSLMSYNKDITLILCYYYGVDIPSELEDDLAVLNQGYFPVVDYSLPEANPVETQTED